VVPGRLGKPDVDAILADVAHAMASAESVLVEYRGADAGWRGGDAGWKEWGQFIPGQSFASAGSRSFYFSTHALYERRTRPDGILSWAQGLDVGEREWWCYFRNLETGEATLYVADLTPIEDAAADLLSRGVDFLMHSESWGEVLGNESLINARAGVTSEIRDNREVTILTFSGWKAGMVLRQTDRPHLTPAIFRARNVFELDTETSQLLGARYYEHLEDEPEQLMGVIDTVQYDSPVPAYMAAVPEAGEIIEASALVEEGTHEGRAALILSMKVGDQKVRHFIVPADWRGDRERAQAPLTPVEAEREQATANMKELALALQLYCAEHRDVFPPVDNVYDLMPLLDEYVSGRHVFMRPGREDDVVVEYLLPPALALYEVRDPVAMPVAVADYHPEFVVIAYADGHVEAADKTDPAYQDGWWEDWWREYLASQ
jgi:prepilin-type processing-associated H-X9-DG protein